jgi:hypothetical protein
MKTKKKKSPKKLQNEKGLPKKCLKRNEKQNKK